MKSLACLLTCLILVGCSPVSRKTGPSSTSEPTNETAAVASTTPVTAGGGQADYDYLKALNGDWIVDGGEEGVFAWSFDDTSKNSIIIERLKVGTPTEMLTIYDLDGDTLTANHFCQLKNSPRLTLTESDVEGDLHFACDGNVGNAESHAELHMHGVHFKKEDDKMIIWMDMFKDDEFAFETRYTLERAE